MLLSDCFDVLAGTVGAVDDDVAAAAAAAAAEADERFCLRRDSDDSPLLDDDDEIRVQLELSWIVLNGSTITPLLLILILIR